MTSCLLAWAGNYYLLGGKVKKQVHGNYPSMLQSSPHVIDRQHRLRPDLPWEAVWNGIASWFGVESEKIDQILPNKANFGDEHIFTKDQLFDG